MSPGGLAPVAAGSAKPRVRGRPPTQATGAAPAGALFSSLTCGAGRQGPRVLASRGAAVLLSRLGWPMSWRDSWRRGGRVRPPSWKSGLARPAAGPPEVLWGTGTVGDRSGHSPSSACAAVAQHLCGAVGRGGELPFLKAPRPPASEEHNPTAEQDAREPQHGQHSRQDHAAAPCGDRSALGQAPLQARDAP